jgi:hypothetical protein
VDYRPPEQADIFRKFSIFNKEDNPNQLKHMKIIYLLLSFTLTSHLFCQTITQSANEPVVGDVDSNYSLDTSAYTSGLPLNIKGANAVWDFSKLSGAFPVVIDSFINPAAATGATAYPGATYSQHRDNIYSFFRSSSNPQQTELMGAYSPSLSLTFSNTAIIAAYPVSFGYNLSDPVSGTFKYNNQNGACNGSITISADAQGTVLLANNVTFTNVLRLKSVEELTMSVGLFPVGSIRQTVYNYYAPGKKFPVLSFTNTKYQLFAGTPTITTLANGNYNYFTVAGVKEREMQQAGFLYPNPFTDKIFVDPASEAGNEEYRICDLNGRVLQSVRTVTEIDAASLASGLYFAEIKTGTLTKRQKMIKE